MFNNNNINECILAIDPGIVNGALVVTDKNNIKDIKVYESFKLSYSGNATKKTVIKDLQKFTDNRLIPLIEQYHVTEVIIEQQMARSAKLNGFEYFVVGLCKGYKDIIVTRITPKQVCTNFDIPKNRKQKKEMTQKIVHDYLSIENNGTYFKKRKEIEDKADAYMLVMTAQKIKTETCKPKNKRKR